MKFDKKYRKHLYRDHTFLDTWRPGYLKMKRVVSHRKQNSVVPLSVEQSTQALS